MAVPTWDVVDVNGDERFYYADERKPDGSPAMGISGKAHGDYYLQLAENEAQGPWLATFVNGTGYVDFSK